MSFKSPPAVNGFTLMEVLFAFGILATALTAVISLQVQSLDTMQRLTVKTEAQLYAEDAYVRFILQEQGYNVEDAHPQLADNRPEWSRDINLEELSMEDLPFVPVLPLGWEVDWVRVEVRGKDGTTLASIKPLWVRSEERDIVSATETTDPTGGN